MKLGDGTTSVVVLAGALLENAELLIDQDVHPTIIVDGYRKAAKKAKQFLESIADQISPNDKNILHKIAKTSMQTKLVRKNSDQLAEIVVQSILSVSEKNGESYNVDIDDIKGRKEGWRLYPRCKNYSGYCS